MEKTEQFYMAHFGFQASRDPDGRIIELVGKSGATLMIHQLAASQKPGQSLVKLVFDVADVEGFVAAAASRGLKFGALHRADGYVFANCRDPAGNSISVSNRAFRAQ